MITPRTWISRCGSPGAAGAFAPDFSIGDGGVAFNWFMVKEIWVFERNAGFDFDSFRILIV